MIQAQPLSGKRIVVTQSTESRGRLAKHLTQLGADVIDLPLINVSYAVDPNQADPIFKEFAHYEWIVFTSRNGVQNFFKLFFQIFEDIRSLGFMRIAAIGSGTQEALKEYYLKADLMPDVATADALLESLKKEQTIDNLKVLVITGNRNREDLIKGLNENRAIVDTLQVYKTELNSLEGNESADRFRKEGADALVFSSGSAVQSFGEQANHLKLDVGASIPALCSFGPTTSSKMKAAGIPIALEASEPGIEGISSALISYFSDK